jgi:hypothetical protein
MFIDKSNKFMMSQTTSIPDEIITSKIYLIRNHKVLLDSDLAELYQVDTKRLNENVKRNSNRFPDDFMFQLSSKEWNNLKSQFATSSWGGRRKPPFVFTEHGVLMLSSVLNSERAIAVNIQVMRIFTRIREVLKSNAEFISRLEMLESRAIEYDERIELIFKYLGELEQERNSRDEQTHRTRIGYKP